MSPKKSKPAKPDKVALYVEVDPDRMDRYKEAAESLGISMRELVTMALDDLLRVRPQTPAPAPAPVAATKPPPQTVRPEPAQAVMTWADFLQAPLPMGDGGLRPALRTNQRVADLEYRIEQLEKRLDDIERYSR